MIAIARLLLELKRDVAFLREQRVSELVVRLHDTPATRALLTAVEREIERGHVPVSP